MPKPAPLRVSYFPHEKRRSRPVPNSQRLEFSDVGSESTPVKSRAVRAAATLPVRHRHHQEATSHRSDPASVHDPPHPAAASSQRFVHYKSRVVPVGRPRGPPPKATSGSRPKASHHGTGAPAATAPPRGHVATAPPGADLRQSPQKKAFVTRSSQLNSHRPSAPAKVKSVAAIFPDHPISVEIQSLTTQRNDLLHRLSGERQSLSALERRMALQKQHLAKSRLESEKLTSRLETMRQQCETLQSGGSLPELKERLAMAVANLSLFTSEYRDLSAALKRAEAEAYGKGAAGKRSATSKLLRTLDDKRLADEEHLIVKYDTQRQKLEAELGEMRDYLDVIHKVEGQLESQLAAGPGTYAKRREDSSATATTATATASAHARSARSTMVVFDEDRRESAMPGTGSESVVLSPDRQQRIAQRRSEADKLRLQLSEEMRAVEAELAKSEAAQLATLEKAKNNVLTAQVIAENNEKELRQLQFAVSNKTTTLQKSDAAVVAESRRTTELDQQAETLQAELDSVAARILDAEEQIATRRQQSTSLQLDLRTAGSTEPTLTEHQQTLVGLAGKLREAKQSSQRLAEEKRQLQQRVAAETESAVSLEQRQKQLQQQHTRSVELRDKAQQLLRETEAQHQSALDALTFTSQKSSIITELKGNIEKWASKRAVLDAQNEDLTKRLAEKVALLKQHNIDIPF